MVELHQSIGVALIMLGDIPKAVACAGNVDGHGRLLGIFAPGSEMLKGGKFTSFTDPYLDDSVHIDLDLPAVDCVDPEVLDSGARGQSASCKASGEADVLSAPRSGTSDLMTKARPFSSSDRILTGTDPR